MKNVIILFVLCSLFGCGYFDLPGDFIPLGSTSEQKRIAILISGDSNCRNFILSGAKDSMDVEIRDRLGADTIVWIPRHKSGSSVGLSGAFDWDKNSENEHWEKFAKDWRTEENRAEKDGYQLILYSHIHIQGGKDILDSMANDYFRNISILDRDIRSFTGSWNMKFVTTRIDDDFNNDPNNNELHMSRQAVEILSQEHPLFYFIDTDDSSKKDKSHYSDEGHFQNMGKFLSVLF